MRDATEEFFDRLSRRGDERLFGDANATLRFDIEQDHGVDRWFLVIRQGRGHLTKQETEPDAVLQTNRALFNRIVTGESNAYTAWMRHEFKLMGDARVAGLFQNLLPAPPGARHPRDFARERRRQR